MTRVMTPAEFKARWEGDSSGGGITWLDIADCAVAWGLDAHPKSLLMTAVVYKVLCHADVVDKEEYNPEKRSCLN